MGYRKSFNLVTIQLIIPLSTMTKAEYKNAYGIDLDDIDIEKVTLVQEEGSKNKYFVDEIKTTESGIDIYAGGKVLSIGSSISVVDDAYSVINSKPIYWHTLYFKRSGAGVSYLEGYLIVLNNSKEQIGVDELIDLFKISGFYGVVLNGLYESTNGATNPTATSRPLIAIRYQDASNVVPIYRDENNVLTALSPLALNASQWVVTDLGANKIN